MTVAVGAPPIQPNINWSNLRKIRCDNAVGQYPGCVYPDVRDNLVLPLSQPLCGHRPEAPERPVEVLRRTGPPRCRQARAYVRGHVPLAANKAAGGKYGSFVPADHVLDSEKFVVSVTS
ncbi:hypothetical protein [Kitasatospora purpeofusca]|uniref:hypothetical protein n=1 Tax=Kitasatospora purpeofusca TaxID=67352 RepID=UPI002A5A4004|nr:hypothetical protein [Kitasatospora purpeofusca]MDY0813007.1 hypothetical protein [Kitasatospora purpeofusca]